MDKFSFKKLGDTIERANITALNRAARSALSRTIRFIRQKYNIKAKELNQQTRIIRATKSKPYVQLVINNRPIGLYEFGARQSKSKGVSAAVQKGKRKVYQSKDKKRKAFIATMPSGHTAVMIRAGEQRLPIKELYGPSAQQLLYPKDEPRKPIDELEKEFKAQYEKNLQHELKYRMGLV